MEDKYKNRNEKTNNKMKNVHVLPTEKPSRLRIGDNGNVVLGLMQNSIVSRNDSFTNYHIYITSDEEIKEGDYTLMFDDFGNLFLCDKPQQYLGIEKGHHLNKGLRKIILTTDQDLIDNGVQAIDDNQLEWFVDNLSCKEVEVRNMKTIPELQLSGNNHLCYKIILPKEESKCGKKQTAVEWLVSEYAKAFKIAVNAVMGETIEQAKAMEKEQIQDAYDEAFLNEDNGEQYYTQTYGGKK